MFFFYFYLLLFSFFFSFLVGIKTHLSPIKTHLRPFFLCYFKSIPMAYTSQRPARPIAGPSPTNCPCMVHARPSTYHAKLCSFVASRLSPCVENKHSHGLFQIGLCFSLLAWRVWFRIPKLCVLVSKAREERKKLELMHGLHAFQRDMHDPVTAQKSKLSPSCIPGLFFHAAWFRSSSCCMVSFLLDRPP